MNKSAHIIILVICASLVILPALFSIDQVGVYFLGIKWPMHCALHQILGVRCALCGMTRAFTSMSHGDIANSFNYHHAGPLLYCFLVMQSLYRLVAIIRYPRKIRKFWRKLNLFTIIIIAIYILIDWLIYLGGKFLW